VQADASSVIWQAHHIDTIFDVTALALPELLPVGGVSNLHSNCTETLNAKNRAGGRPHAPLVGRKLALYSSDRQPST